MAEIRHDRPILRYLDNLRRESHRITVPEDQSAIKPKTEKSAPRRLQQEKNEYAYTRHLEALELLPERSQVAIGRLVEDASTLMEARIAYIQNIGQSLHGGKRAGKRKTKSKYDDAIVSLRAACAAYNIHCKAELKDGKSVTREWWAKLRVVMGAEWEPFEEVDEFIKETR